MTAQPITENQHRQLKQFLENFVASAVQAALEQVVPELDKDSGQLAIERGDELKADVEKATVNSFRRISKRYPIIGETRLLRPIAVVNAPARTKPFDTSEFYQNRPGLYVWDSFRERLDIENCELVPSAPERPYVASLLKKDAYDRDIRRELPESHLSTLEDIAGFIEAQPEGKQGFLLNNGYANIFYVAGKNGEIFAVDVGWGSDDRVWFVGGWRLGGLGGWSAGYHVVCPGNASL